MELREQSRGVPGDKRNHSSTSRHKERESLRDERKHGESGEKKVKTGSEVDGRELTGNEGERDGERQA